MNLNTQLITQRFSKSLTEYESNAVVQNRMNIKLIENLPVGCCFNPVSIFEFGCGPGNLSELIMNKIITKKLFINDIVLDAGEYVKNRFVSDVARKIHFIHGNAETIRFPENIDFIISGSTFQWFSTPVKMIAKCYNSLRNDGLLAISTFGTDNLKEIYKLTGYGLHYHDVRTYESWLNKYFSDVKISDERVTLYFPSPVDVLLHLKRTGVTGLHNGGWTKSRHEKFIADYQMYRTESGYPLTYHPVYMYARKKTVV